MSWPANISVMTSSRMWRLESVAAVLVGGLEQQAEDVLAALAAGAAAIDLAEDERVQARARAQHPPPRRPRPAQDLARVVARPEAERLLELVRPR